LAIIARMNGLSDEQLAGLTERLAERKAVLVSEIRQVLARSGNERDADLAGGVGDATDGSVPEQLRDIAEAEAVRDIGEASDISAAQERIAAGRYGLCIDCGATIGYERLDAYPSAKRCLACQQRREKNRTQQITTR